MIESFAYGLKGLGGGTERIFVGGKFGDLLGIQSVFLGYVGDGATWFVGVEFGHIRIGEGVHEMKVRVERGRNGFGAPGRSRGLFGFWDSGKRDRQLRRGRH